MNFKDKEKWETVLCWGREGARWRGREKVKGRRKAVGETAIRGGDGGERREAAGTEEEAKGRETKEKGRMMIFI